MLLAASCLVLIHALYAIASAILLPQLPFHTAHHAFLALVWLLVGSCVSRAARRSHAPLLWLRPVLVLGILLYLYGIYACMALYLGGGVFPPTYMKSLIWSVMMATAFTTLLLVLEVQQVSGRETLLVGCNLPLGYKSAVPLLQCLCCSASATHRLVLQLIGAEMLCYRLAGQEGPALTGSSEPCWGCCQPWQAPDTSCSATATAVECPRLVLTFVLCVA
jgi:hypothetical protein